MAVVYQEATRCTGRSTPGADAMVAQWRRTTGLGSYGTYNCRPPRGGDGYSIHAEGRAADLACNAYSDRQRATGDAYAGWLIANDDELGCQGLIWNRRSWRSDRGWRSYSGVNPHTDHLHVELTRAKAANPSRLWSTDWRGPNEEAELMAAKDDIIRALKAHVTAEIDSVQRQLTTEIDNVQSHVTRDNDVTQRLVLTEADSTQNKLRLEVDVLQRALIEIGKAIADVERRLPPEVSG